VDRSHSSRLCLRSLKFANHLTNAGDSAERPSFEFGASEFGYGGFNVSLEIPQIFDLDPAILDFRPLISNPSLRGQQIGDPRFRLERMGRHHIRQFIRQIA
jgi:hypothetical protein